MLIASGRSQPAEVHRIESRLDFEAFADAFPRRGLRRGLPSVYVRASGYILLVALAVVVSYSATLLTG
jgi:hypothetical protein